MLEKMRLFSVKSYVKTTDLMETLKKDERGVSEVVMAAMLLLMGALICAFLWGGLDTLITDTWNTIIGDEGTGGINPLG